jgi:membrane associated rhomboid family serine protease
MFPLRDSIRSRHFPVMNWLLVGANALVFLFELSLSPGGREAFIQQFALVPAHLLGGDPRAWLTLLTSMFMHGGWFHFISNMWILFIFGDNVEDRMGSFPYLVFYLLSGAVAGLLQVFVYPDSLLPTLGASGAIAGVLGAYIFLFPKARVVTFIPIFLFPWIVEIQAFIFLGFWFISQLYSGFAALSLPSGADMGGVAWWAHVGGFVFGLLLGRFFLLRPPPPPPRRYYQVSDVYDLPPEDYR